MWESGEEALARLRREVELLFLALEDAAAAATDTCHGIGVDPARFSHAWAGVVRSLAWVRSLDDWQAQGELACGTEGNGGISIYSGLTVIKPLHVYEGGLPPAQSLKRRNFYQQPLLGLFDLEGTWLMSHLVALWDYRLVEGLSMRLVAPKRADELRNPHWDIEVPHPFSEATIDTRKVSVISGERDDVEELQLYEAEEPQGEDAVEDVALLGESPPEDADEHAEGEDG